MPLKGLPRLPGPLLPCELKRAVTRQRHFGWRAGYALILFSCLWLAGQAVWWYAGMAWGPRSIQVAVVPSVCHWLFVTFGCLQLVASAFVFPITLGTSIARERQRQTLEGLLATGLLGREIVVGKWLASVSSLLMSLCGGLPAIVALAVFGGAGAERIAVLTVLTMSTALVSGALCVAISTYNKEPSVAWFVADVVVFYTPFVPFFLWHLIEGTTAAAVWLGIVLPLGGQLYDAAQAVIGVLFCVNPIAVFLAPELGGRYIWLSPAAQFAWVFVLHAAITYLAIAIASRRLDRYAYWTQSWVERSQIKKRQRTQKKELPRVSDHPIRWKEWHFMFGFRAGAIGLRFVVVCVLLGVLLGLVIAGLPGFADYLDGRPFVVDLERFEEFLAGTQVYIVLLAGLLAAAIAASSIVGERDKRTWSLLLDTELSAREILAGKAIGALRAPLTMLIVWFGIWLVAIALGQLCFLAIPWMVAGIVTWCLFNAVVAVRQSLRRPRAQSAAAMAMIPSAVVALGALVFLVAVMRKGIGGSSDPFDWAHRWMLACPATAFFRWEDIHKSHFVPAMLAGLAGMLALLAITAGILLHTVRSFDRYNEQVARAHERQDGRTEPGYH